MKNGLVCLILFVPPAAAAVPMSRVVEVRDGRTIVVDTNGVTAAVPLRGVVLSPAEEPQAVAYLRRTLVNSWVYVENGEVYRSPDGLHVNGAMSRRAWLNYTSLGDLDLAPPAKRQASAGKAAPPAAKKGVKRVSPAPRRRPSSPPGRPRRPRPRNASP